MAWVFLQVNKGEGGFVEMCQRASLMIDSSRLCGDDWVLQLDNAAVHYVHLAFYFQENNLTLLDHPGCSPDSNPNENIWGWMVREVYENEHRFQTVDGLREAIFTNLSKCLLETLASSMPNQIFEVLNKNGVLFGRFHICFEDVTVFFIVLWS